LSAADAGNDQTLCAVTTTTMAATAAAGGATGAWSLISGTGTITTPASETSGLTALGLGANTFRWTVSKAGCTSVTDDVIITREASCLQLNLKSPSFDTAAVNGEFLVSPWSSCGLCCSGLSCSTGPTPDTQDAFLPAFGLPGPTDGLNYVGFFSGDAATSYEAISQELVTPMVAGSTYQFNIDLAYKASNDIVGVEFVVMGGYSCCTWSEELASVTVGSASWTTKTITFTPTYSNTYIMLRAKDNNTNGQANYVFIDNMTNINTSGTAGSVCSPTDTNQCNPIVLPVELVSFDAAKKNETVLVSWITASEINNDYFTVERSDDGISFEKIGYVIGNGNSSQVINYQFIDQQPLKGTSYYRLRQTDYNGVNEVFDMVAIKFLSEGEIGDIYPNPSANSLFFDIGRSSDEVYTIVYTNVLGSIVYTEQLLLSEEKLTYQLKGFEELNSDIYFVKIIDSNQQVRKIQKILKR